MFKIYKAILLIIPFFPVCPGMQAQTIERFNTFSYNVNEGLLQSTMQDMAFDKNNFCWLSFPNGIQKFDGKNFIAVPVQPGLPDDKFVYFFRCSNGDLLISHSQGISKYEITGNRFTWFYTNRPGEKTPAIFIGEDENIIYVFTESGNITGINCHTLKMITETSTGFRGYSYNDVNRPWVMKNIINHKVALQINSSFCLWDLKKRKLLHRSDSVHSATHSLMLKTEDEVLYYNSDNILQVYNFTTNNSSIVTQKVKDNRLTGSGNTYQWQNKTLLYINNKLYETDTSLQVIKSELVNFQNQPIASVLAIARMREDNFGNLYLATLNSGIKKIIRNNYPIKYYGTGKSEGNFIVSILPDKKNNIILAGTAGNGLLVFDTLQHLIKHIKTLPGISEHLIVNTIIKTNTGSYLLFITGEKNVWQLSNDLTKIKPIKISTALPEKKGGIDYYGNFLFQNERQAVTQSQRLLYKTYFAANTVTAHEITTSNILSGLHYNTVIIIHANDELIFLDAETFKELKKISFKNTGGVRCFTKDKAGNIYMGSNKGVFIIDSAAKILLRLNRENGLPDDCIYAMAIDDKGFLWGSTNKGIFRVNKDNSILQLKKEDGLQENEFNTNSVAKTDDGELFFGGVNGLSSFYPEAISSFEEKINLFFTHIKANNEPVLKDTAMWAIDKISLSYKKNSLSFDFIAMGSGNPEQYIYQYKMEGIDKEWVQNSGAQTVRYFLQPGKYTFQLYASRQFDNNAKPLKEITIIIKPPFWKTWWFLTLLAVLFISGMMYTINQFNKRKYRKKLLALEGKHKMQLERERIARDLHDNLGVQANAILHNSTLLNPGNENYKNVVADLQDTAKEMLLNLRETLWAMKTADVSAADVWLRIINFMKQMGRHYTAINFKAEGDVPKNFVIVSNKALNIVLVLQESVNNAVKHAVATTITAACTNNSNEWIITIKDDGKGFDMKTVKEKTDSFGLQNMKERAISGNFIYSIETSPGKGTTTKISISS